MLVAVTAVTAVTAAVVVVTAAAVGVRRKHSVGRGLLIDEGIRDVVV